MAEEKVESDLKLKRKGKFSRKNGGNIKRRKKFNDMRSHQKKYGARKVEGKMKRLFQKRAREYNSDEEDDDEHNTQKLEGPVGTEFDDQKLEGSVGTEFDDTEGQGEKENVVDEKDSDEEDEEGAIQPGIMRFSEGCKAFRLAFKKITKRSPTDDDVLGPVLSAHKKLVVAKLAEEEEERKVKGEGKKEKHLVQEKGHAKLANYLDSHEKFLIGIATKGVVKLFNAVNKAQNAQKGLNPSRSKDAKAIRKRRKEAFFSELGKKSSKPGETSGKVGSSANTGKGDGPSWAPLRENYMLTNPKSKDWDKNPDDSEEEDFGGRTVSDTDTSTDEE